MMKYMILLVTIILSNNCSAQFGVGTIYRTGNPVPSSILEKLALADLNLSYRFKLKNYRVEFVPNLSYSLFSNSTYLDENSDLSIDLNQYGIGVQSKIYPLDIEGDCNCPTWSKQGGIIKKGLFLFLELNQFFNQYKIDTSSKKIWNYSSAAIGAGLDIAIAKKLAITPSIGYEWCYQNEVISNKNLNNRIRLGLTLEYNWQK